MFFLSGLPDVSIYKGDELLSVMKVKEKLFLNSKDGQLYDLVTVDGLADRKCSSKVSDDYVREVLNFIEANGLSYGILCSDVDFYFLWWERSNKTLHISASQTVRLATVVLGSHR